MAAAVSRVKVMIRTEAVRMGRVRVGRVILMRMVILAFWWFKLMKKAIWQY